MDEGFEKDTFYLTQEFQVFSIFELTKNFEIMKNNFSLIISIFYFLFLCTSFVNAQAFRKGSLLISVSEGYTFGKYSTSTANTEKPELKHEGYLGGERDPLIIEYGLSNRWGIGLTSGNDIFKINPAQFYNFSVSDNQVKMATSELTIDGNYHVYVNKRLDLSVFASLGMFSIKAGGNDGDFSYNYVANGNIIRLGTRARYYFMKRFGLIGMVSNYAASGSPKNVKEVSVGNNFSTSLSGFAIETGLSFRLLK